MQTTITWLEQEFIKLESTIGVHGKMYELIEQAKEMEKQQSLELIELSSQLTGVATVDDEISKMTYVDVYNQYYRSKGSDDLLTEEEIAEFKRELKEVMKKPKTEISDEEIYNKAAFHDGSDYSIGQHNGFIEGALWYREQIS